MNEEAALNKVTNDIAAFCECSMERAWEIQQRMMTNGFDFSEASEQDFHRAVLVAMDVENGEAEETRQVMLDAVDEFTDAGGGTMNCREALETIRDFVD